MTLRSPAPLRAWIPLADLMLKPLPERVKYVRENLATSRERSSNPYLSHDDFAQVVGAGQRSSAIRWEKPRAENGSAPRRYAQAIAALTPYPKEAFGAPGEAELVQETLGLRLRSLEAEIHWLRSQLTRAFAALELELEPEPREAAPLAQSGGAPL